MFKWLSFLVIWTVVFIFLFFFQPFPRIPVTAFSYIWSFVFLIGSIDLFYSHVQSKPRIIFRSILVGLLIGAFFVSVRATVIDLTLIRDALIALFPLALYHDIIFFE